MIEEEKAAKKKQEEEDAELAAWFVAEIIKEEEAAKNKNQEVNDAQGELEEEDNAQWVKEDDGRKELARTLYSDAVAEIVKEVKSSDTGSNVCDGVKNETDYASFTSSVSTGREFVIEFLSDAFILRWVREENGRTKLAMWHSIVMQSQKLTRSSDYLSFLECFETWEITEMIKEEEAQHEEDDAQLNEAGEAEEEDDPR
ncbi:hypothetical protein DY000_02010490 [Brassica cretica]|uniref:Uncharacterized protein n=1 Tax=Brassica cretica TaxID=69181 RepID=A0ABQ7CEZ2_BRACR|nr:hypothetical protein DY000_02010490 [Brassica cretica]